MASKRAALIALATARAASPDKPRLVEAAGTTSCAYSGCQRPFTPVQAHQKCCSDACRYKRWAAIYRPPMPKGGIPP
jgi:hypothetical protein